MAFALKKTKSDRVVDAVIYTVLILFCLATLFPVYFVIVMSITPYVEVLKNGGFVLWPNSVTFDAFKTIFSSNTVPKDTGLFPRPVFAHTHTVEGTTCWAAGRIASKSWMVCS